MLKPIFILFTMDVELLKLNPLWTGPEDRESSDLYIKHYWNMCTEYGYTPSFFIHPEAALTVSKGVSPRNIDVEELRKDLLSHGAIV